MDKSLEELIKKLPDFFQPDRAEGVFVVAQLELLEEPLDYWTLHIENQKCDVFHKPAENPQISLKAQPEDLMANLSGNLNVTRAFMFGKIKLEGKIKQALKLMDLFEIPEEYQSNINK